MEEETKPTIGDLNNASREPETPKVQSPAQPAIKTKVRANTHWRDLRPGETDELEHDAEVEGAIFAGILSKVDG